MNLLQNFLFDIAMTLGLIAIIIVLLGWIIEMLKGLTKMMRARKEVESDQEPEGEEEQ